MFDFPAGGWDATVRWTPDGRALTYNNGGELWTQPLSGGPRKLSTDFKPDQIFSFDWSRDGQLLLSRGLSTSDVVLISDLK